MKSPSGFGVVLVVMIVSAIAFNAALLWFAASAATSGVKAFTNSCDKTYVVEKVFSGDWFCPARK